MKRSGLVGGRMGDVAVDANRGDMYEPLETLCASCGLGKQAGAGAVHASVGVLPRSRFPQGGSQMKDVANARCGVPHGRLVVDLASNPLDVEAGERVQA